MNPGRFYMPGYMGMGNNFASSPVFRMANVAPRGMGLFGRIANGIRSVNWGGFFNNANKTLNVVNQAIPLVRQAGPMVNNMKSMLKIAKVFRNETSSSNSNNRRITNNFRDNDVNHNVNNKTSSHINENVVQKKEVSDDSYPNFFV